MTRSDLPDLLYARMQQDSAESPGAVRDLDWFGFCP
jgi:hypothetical protein